MDDVFAPAEHFLRTNARLLERRLFDATFHGGPPAAVVDVLRGYQNEDGGFGHGLEPDKRCPASLPIDVEQALRAMADAGTVEPGMVLRACDFLGAVAGRAGAGGAVPLAFPVIEGFPRAAHWSAWTYEPGLNPTAGLAGLLHRLGVEHPWRSAATAWCRQRLDDGPLPDEVHSASEVLVLLEHVPDRAWADPLAERVVGHLRSTQMFHLDPGAPGYGLSPLDLAPLATSRWRGLFDADRVDAHLQHLLSQQQADGGWPVSWEPPGPAALLEWRGIVTLKALHTLTSYGVVTQPT
ncbi:hypothetical protein [Kineosporia sp. A_224]|uniref:hypothetical protein n=1 Tax=Kineosporia sp. A_224 TaxID=1962180 RepID=UPI000B4BA19D|nr:hypothetical protein [Kineosporia sp. A_224]